MTVPQYPDALRRNLKVYVGATLREQFAWSNDDGTVVDLTGWSGVCKVRAGVTGPLVGTAVVTCDVNGAGVYFPAALSLALGDGVAWYDVLVTSPDTADEVLLARGWLTGRPTASGV